jgi:hypothetical protein
MKARLSLDRMGVYRFTPVSAGLEAPALRQPGMAAATVQLCQNFALADFRRFAYLIGH